MTDRPHLLLLPGLLCDDRLWKPQVEALSGLADITIADMTLDDTMAGMARRALDTVPQRFALAGLSMGGYVALEMMRQAPERVTKLALLDTGARADTPEQTTRRRDLIALADRGEFKAVSPRLLPLFVHEARLTDSALIADITAMAESVGKDAFLRQQTAIMNRPDSRPGLAGIACPTLVLCGRDDILTPPDLSEEMADLVPGADFVLIEDCGHLSTMEQPAAVNAALSSWLAG
tara:strand:- start:10750 stop:11451 length:702 start_codon:yes stop_codon:yes gene_type:complete